MRITVHRQATYMRVPNTPAALFQAAGLLALGGVLLALWLHLQKVDRT